MYILLCNSIGPMVNMWCMRMEAKSSYFKRVAQIRNFRNLPLSVAKRHQRLLCGHLQGKLFVIGNKYCYFSWPKQALMQLLEKVFVAQKYSNTNYN